MANLEYNILGYCPRCGRYFQNVSWFRRGTAYQDKELNWDKACVDCAEDEKKNVSEMWSDYYSSLGI